MLEATMKVEGLKEAFDVIAKAFPKDPKKQRGILNAGMRSAAKKAIVPAAKQMALTGDSSGALSESITVRATSKKDLRRRGAVAGVKVVPLRSSIKAIQMYAAHYYTSRGLAPPTSLLADGIRHGHLVEFGSVHNNPSPFLLPASKAGRSAFTQIFVADLKKKTFAAIKRARKRK
jgi:hypothetical protein